MYNWKYCHQTNIVILQYLILIVIKNDYTIQFARKKLFGINVILYY